MIRSIIVGGALATSIVVGVFASLGSTDTSYNVGRGIHRAIADQPTAARDDGTYDYNDLPNIEWPMLSEDRYVDGEWTGPVVPFELPHASGQCDPCN